MTEVENRVEMNGPEILQYYHFRNTSVKLVKHDGRYVVTAKKYILYFFKRKMRFEFTNYNAAEDKYLEIKSDLQYRGRSY
ncbi:MAG: hypothetical protein HF309_18050 [Ignavibacteria bacterium]|jgi:hypothetical protein|nr:hypothetical protein [Ignavibacteria bacterium]MCU7501181.1 hypothetical protein [Ignavibacteria bacterium]MCU7521135.1 hypothetical protein [Ignavibacteria bacterium]MCU7526511.1 hypothetical protein [Ignavibacteria bacterium]